MTESGVGFFCDGFTASMETSTSLQPTPPPSQTGFPSPAYFFTPHLNSVRAIILSFALQLVRHSFPSLPAKSSRCRRFVLGLSSDDHLHYAAGIHQSKMATTLDADFDSEDEAFAQAGLGNQPVVPRRFENAGESTIFRMVENQLIDRVDSRVAFKKIDYLDGSIGSAYARAYTKNMFNAFLKLINHECAKSLATLPLIVTDIHILVCLFALPV